MAEPVIVARPSHFRPMGIGDILDATFRLYREKFATLMVIALVVFVPYAVIRGGLAAMGGVATLDLLSNDAPRQAPDPLIAFGNLLETLVLLAIVVPVCEGAIMHCVSANYLGENLSAWDSYRRALPRVLPLVGTQFLAGIVVMLGMLALIVPGIIFSLRYTLNPAVVMLEGVAGMAALKRSTELMRGNLGKAFSLLFLAAMLALLMEGFAGVLVGLVIKNRFLFEFFAQIVEAMVLPIQVTPLILLYYDLRIRKEAFDLQQLAQQLGQSPPPIPP